jgi:hypothetical protein
MGWMRTLEIVKLDIHTCIFKCGGHMLFLEKSMDHMMGVSLIELECHL